MPVTIRKTNIALGNRTGPGVFIYLGENNWDDYGYKNLFHLSIENEHGELFNIGDLKIGYSTQPINTWSTQAITDGCDGFIDGIRYCAIQPILVPPLSALTYLQLPMIG